MWFREPTGIHPPFPENQLRVQRTSRAPDLFGDNHNQTGCCALNSPSANASLGCYPVTLSVKTSPGDLSQSHQDCGDSYAAAEGSGAAYSTHSTSPPAALQVRENAPGERS